MKQLICPNFQTDTLVTIYNMSLLDRCREFENRFPLSPQHWYQAQQYKVSQNVLKQIKNAWSLGIGKDARHERWIRVKNENCLIHCFDPTPISKDTVIDNNWVVNFYMARKKPKFAGVNLLQYHDYAYHRSGKQQLFYTHDNANRCFSMYSNKRDPITVRTVTFEDMISKAGVPEYIKFDIEGMWFEFCEDLFKHNLEVLQINGEYEMNYDRQDLAFEKLNSVVEMAESKGYKIYCNRKLDTWNIELSFINKELV